MSRRHLPAARPSPDPPCGSDHAQTLTGPGASNAADLPPDFDLRECYREEFGDVPATVQDYQTGQPSRCAQRIASFQSDAQRSILI